MNTWKIRILQPLLPFSFVSPLAQCHPVPSWLGRAQDLEILLELVSHRVSWREKMQSLISRESQLSQLPQPLQLLQLLNAFAAFVPSSWCFNNSTRLYILLGHVHLNLSLGLWYEMIHQELKNMCPIEKIWFGYAQRHCKHVCNATGDHQANRCRSEVALHFEPFYIFLHPSIQNLSAHVPTLWAMLAALNSALAQFEYQATWWWEGDVWLK